MMADFRALCAELADELTQFNAWYIEDNGYGLPNLEALLQRCDAALADEPAVPEGMEPVAVTGQPRPTVPTIDDVWELCEEHGFHLGIDGANEEESANGLREIILTALARWGTPNLAETRRSSEDAPAPPADGEVAELVAALKNQAIHCTCDQLTSGDLRRAAELLQRQALVPVSVSDALIKAECALSDIAEGEPMTDEGDPLQWTERRCADTLAIIRPTMRQHNIRTSEWPPVPAHALPLAEAQP